MNSYSFRTLTCFPKIYWKSQKTHQSFYAWGKKKKKQEKFFYTKFFDETWDELWDSFSSQDSFTPKEVHSGKVERLPYPMPALCHVETTPDFLTWKKNIEKAKSSFTNDLQKVVLARKTTLTFSESLDPFALFSHTTGSIYHFFYQPEKQVAFFGSSPEGLFYRKGSAFFSEAIAGTRARGESPVEDEAYRKELLHDPKELEEFFIVKDFIQRKIQPYVSHITSSKNDIIQTKYVQHLYSKIQGICKKTTSDSSLIEALHPTPATLGNPSQSARDFLRENETFSRGLYAGSLGWMSDEETEIAVGIRSALVKKNMLHIYAGTGIVSASDPEKEWAELDQKIKPFTDLLCLKPTAIKELQTASSIP